MDREKLIENGIDYDDSLRRYLNNEKLYKKVLLLALNDDSFQKFQEAFKSGDVKLSFRLAHTFKGVSGSAGLKNVTDLICPIVELLRAGKTDGIEEMLPVIINEYDKAMRAIKEYTGD